MKKGFLSGFLTALVLLGLIGTASATIGRRTVNIDYNNINVTLNGKAVELVDANGNAVEPFAINGTTYLPVRAVSTALGLDVSWDGATSTVILSDPSSGSSAESPSNNTVLPSSTERQMTAYAFLRAWIDSNYNNTINGDHEYCESYTTTTGSEKYSLVFNEPNDVITLRMQKVYNGTVSYSYLSLRPEGEVFFSGFSYYQSTTAVQPTFEGNGIVDPSNFNENSGYTFSTCSGDLQQQSLYESLAKLMYLSTLNFADYVFENYVYGDYSISDFGFNS